MRVYLKNQNLFVIFANFINNINYDKINIYYFDLEKFLKNFSF